MKLERKELIDYEKEWLNNHPNKDNNPQEYISFLDGITDIIEKHEYEQDDRFVTYGRRDFLRKEFTDYLDEKTYSGRGKYNDAFVDLAEYYSGNTWIDMSSVPQELNFHEIDNQDTEYRNEGIICKQEIDIIKDMIKEFKLHLKELQVGDGTPYIDYFKKNNKEKNPEWDKFINELDEKIQ